MSRVAISIQTLDGRKDAYLRKEVGTMHKGTILAAVEEMLAHPDAHTIGKLKPTFKGRTPKRQPAYKPDEEALPGAEVDAKVDEAMRELAAAA